MQEDPINQPEPTEEPREGIIRQGQRRWGKSSAETSTGQREAPRVIDVLHHPPEPKAPVFRIPQDAQARLADAQVAAQKAEQEIAQIQDHFRSRERELREIKQTVYIKEKELSGFRRQMDQLKPVDLDRRFEEAFWRYTVSPFDQTVLNEFLRASALAANSRRIKSMLEAKIAGIESELANAQTQAAELEKELGTESTE